KCDNCASRGTCSGSCSKIEKEKLNDLASVKKVIGVMSGKGGVGKSTVTSMLAVAMSRAGYKAGILDADILGPSIPKMFGLKTGVKGTDQALFPKETHNGIQVMSVNLLLGNPNDPVVWRGSVVSGTVKQFWTDVVWNELDVLFIDMPPGTGDVPLTVFQSIPIDGVVIVTSPQELVKEIVGKSFNMTKMMEVPVIGLAENYSYVKCPDCDKEIYIFGQGKTEEAAKEYGVPLLAKIPMDQKVAELADAGEMDKVDVSYVEALAKQIEGLLK
ncbi:MAG: Mrp/NBP35 family ATP-binding protein, partial [Monoglobales bacterium]